MYCCTFRVAGYFGSFWGGCSKARVGERARLRDGECMTWFIDEVKLYFRGAVGMEVGSVSYKLLTPLMPTESIAKANRSLPVPVSGMATSFSPMESIAMDNRSLEVGAVCGMSLTSFSLIPMKSIAYDNKSFWTGILESSLIGVCGTCFTLEIVGWGSDKSFSSCESISR